MTMSRPLPLPKEVKDLFEELLGRPVTVGPADPIRVADLCNILTSLLNREGLPHLKMNRTFMPGEQPPADTIGYLLALGRRLDLMVDVQGYGSGRFTIALAN
jgi:hypothetical protein